MPTNYLAIFDHGKAIGLYHSKRLASPGQRIVLYAKDRGCTHPGCPVPGYYCEVHHSNPYATCHTTDVNDLTLACGPNHKLAEQGWTTRKNTNGQTEWIPPPHLDHGHRLLKPSTPVRMDELIGSSPTLYRQEETNDRTSRRRCSQRPPLIRWHQSAAWATRTHEEQP